MFEVAFSEFLSPETIMDFENMRKLQDDDMCFVKSYFGCKARNAVSPNLINFLAAHSE